MLTADAHGRTCLVPLRVTDGHSLISICQERDIPARGTREEPDNALTWPSHQSAPSPRIGLSPGCPVVGVTCNNSM
jgi:hypothetical protein